jgi:hypothetical protein
VLLEEIRTAGLLRSTGVTPFLRYYEPIRHPLAVSRFPGCSGYTAYPASALSGRDEEGFSSCSMRPCLRAIANHPAGATRRVDRLRRAMLPSPSRLRARPPGLLTYGATLRSLSLRPENSLPPLQMGVSRGFRPLVSLRPALQLRGFRFLPRQDWLLLDTSAFPGRTTGRGTLAPSGSYDPVAGRIPICHRTNRLGSRRATRPSQCAALV